MSDAAEDRPVAIAVLIVAYRNPEQLAECLSSVEAHLPASVVSIWDNSGTGDDSVRRLADDWPSVRWHLGSSNLGFAAAVNRLAAEVTAPYFLLLNPDAVLLSDLYETRVQIARPQVAAAAPRILDPGGAADWDVAHKQLTLARAVVDYAGYAPRLRGRWCSSLYAQPTTDVSGYLTGACLAINTRAWREVGGFAEEYFLYGEEAQWQRRAREAGWRLVLADESGVRHGGHGTVRDDPAAGLRSRDLLRSNIALNIEQSQSVHHADAYLAGTSLLDRVQRSARRRRAAYSAAAASDKPAVVITTNRLVYGGAERQHVLLATELDRRGYHVVIACVQRFGPLIAEIPPSVRVVRQPWWAPAIDLPPGPQVIISGDTNTETGFATVWRAAGRGRRWLVAPHTPPNPEMPTYSTGLGLAMRRADAFIALSQRHWTQATNYQSLGDRVFVAPNGVMSAAEMARVPEIGGHVAGRPLRLVMLSRIVEHKNPHILVQALANLHEYSWELDIFGDGPDRVRLEALTPPGVSDRVRWRGWSPGPDHAFTEADLVCVPSRSEAFPLVIVEAMARRLPVAASSVCAVPDMLDNGVAGIVVAEPTVDSWTTALAQVFRDTSTLGSLAERGFARASTMYTVDAMTDAYEEAIGAVCEQ